MATDDAEENYSDDEEKYSGDEFEDATAQYGEDEFDAESEGAGDDHISDTDVDQNTPSRQSPTPTGQSPRAAAGKHLDIIELSPVPESRSGSSGADEVVRSDSMVNNHDFLPPATDHDAAPELDRMDSMFTNSDTGDLDPAADGGAEIGGDTARGGHLEPLAEVDQDPSESGEAAVERTLSMFANYDPEELSPKMDARARSQDDAQDDARDAPDTSPAVDPNEHVEASFARDAVPPEADERSDRQSGSEGHATAPGVPKRSTQRADSMRTNYNVKEWQPDASPSVSDADEKLSSIAEQRGAEELDDPELFGLDRGGAEGKPDGLEFVPSEMETQQAVAKAEQAVVEGGAVEGAEESNAAGRTEALIDKDSQSPEAALGQEVPGDGSASAAMPEQPADPSLGLPCDLRALPKEQWAGLHSPFLSKAVAEPESAEAQESPLQGEEVEEEARDADEEAAEREEEADGLSKLGDFRQIPMETWEGLTACFEGVDVENAELHTPSYESADEEEEEPPPEDRLTKFLFGEDGQLGQIPYAEMEKARLKFEGVDGPPGVTARRKLREQIGVRKTETEAEKFLKNMKEKGEGSITIAWRRYFDSDGDGELSFGEFCDALVDFEYKGDVVKLWHALGKGAKELSLEMLDPVGAEILETFCNWCIDVKGGPYEAFKEMDDDGSDSLEPDEFAAALEEMGFFDKPNLPETVASAEAVLKNLYPLLDQSGLGCVQAEQVLFLEKDKDKRAKIAKEIERIKEFGHEAMLEPLTKEAFDHLHQTYMEHTPLGGKHYKLLRGGRAELACGAGSPPRSVSPRLGEWNREVEPYKFAEPRMHWPKVQPKVTRKKVDKKRSKSTPALAATPALTGATPPVVSPPVGPKPGSILKPACDLAVVSSPTGFKRRVSGWGGGNKRLLPNGGSLFDGIPDTKPPKGAEPRLLYTRSQAPPLPPIEDFIFARGTAEKLLPPPKKPVQARDYYFDPNTATTNEFFFSRKMRSLYNHYDSVGPLALKR